MLPGFPDGGTLLFQGPPKPGAVATLLGKIVLIERDSYPGIFFIKRLTSINESGIWVEGDNKGESTDSRKWGYLAPHEIIGVAIRS